MVGRQIPAKRRYQIFCLGRPRNVIWLMWKIQQATAMQDGVSVHTEEQISQPSGVQNQEGWGSSIGVVSANIRMPPSCGTPDDASHGNDV